MKNIAVFENDYDSVRGVFETVKILLLNNLTINLFANFSNDSISKTLVCEHAFIDIDYDIIKKLLDDKFDKNKISIITGHSVVIKELVEHGLPEDIRIFNKPLEIDDIYKLLL
jgi:hypothetical protein